MAVMVRQQMNTTLFSGFRRICIIVNGHTDGRTYGRTDRPFYRDARTHLKTNSGRHQPIRTCLGSIHVSVVMIQNAFAKILLAGHIVDEWVEDMSDPNRCYVARHGERHLGLFLRNQQKQIAIKTRVQFYGLVLNYEKNDELQT